MTAIIVFIICLMVFTSLTRGITIDSSALPGAEVIMTLGFVLLAAYLFGKSVSRFRLPKITGYLLAGIFLGPYFLNYLSHNVVEELKLIDDIALSLIALTAGGEFRLENARKRVKLLSNVIFWQILLVLIGVTFGIVLLGQWLTYFQQYQFSVILGTGLVFGSLAIAKSPATTIAIITETHSRGPLTDLILEVTVTKDIIVVLVFALMLALAEPLIIPEKTFQISYVIKVLIEIGISLVIGVIVGALLYLYMRYIKTQTFLFLMGIILLIIVFSRIVHLEIVLVFMMAGFMVQNFSQQGEKLIHAIETNSLPVYVTFFTLAGSSLNFDLFLKNWFLTLFIVSIRLGSTFMGTWVGTRLSGAARNIQKYSWMGFIGQAGVTLSLTIIVGRTISGEIGNFITTIMIAVIAINELIGPVLFRYALDKSGEIPEPAEAAGVQKVPLTPRN